MTLLILVSSRQAHGAPGDVDSTFNAGLDADLGSTPVGVFGSATQPDGKLVIGGNFNETGGITRFAVARLNADTTLDSGYNPNAAANPFNYGSIKSCIVQPDGKVILGGVFSSFGGLQRDGIVRINANGTLETAFNPNVFDVLTSAIQSDGKILIGGDFTSVGGVPRQGIARLNANGTLDTGFGITTNGSGYGISVQPDGKIIIGGSFVTVNGTTRNRLARLNIDGTVDTAFNPNVSSIPGNQVNCTALQADGKILIGGRFPSVGGTPRTNLARVNSNGTLDSAFNPGVNNRVTTITVQCDGKIIIGGWFNSVAGTTRRYIARLNANGTLDNTFTVNGSGFSEAVAQTCLQADGKVIVAGEFQTAGGVARTALARLINDPATQNLAAISQSRVQWLRGGSSPETHLTTFDLSTDGGNSWTPLGEGTRITGGWEKTGLNLPSGGSIRGRARNCGGDSTGIVESVAAFAFPEIAVFAGNGTDAPELMDGQAGAIPFPTTRLGEQNPPELNFTISNPGAQTLRVNSITVPAGYSLQNPPAFPADIAVNASLTITVRLNTGATGTFAGQVVIASNDSNEAAFDFPVTGTIVTPEIGVHDGPATTAPELTDDHAAAVDFGRNVQGTPVTRTFTIANNGSVELLVSNLTVPAGYTLLNLPTLPFTVGIGQSVPIQISLTTLAPGAHSGRVTIVSDDFDEASFDFPVTGEVFIPDPVASVPASTTVLNRQTGLREQTIHITNDTTATVPAYNLIIRGLPDGVEVNNASERRADGSWVVYVRQAMNPRTAQDILLEYFSANRGPVEIAPQLSTEVVLNPPDLSVPGAPGFVIDRVMQLAGGAVLIEFPTTPGRQYQVQYSHDGMNWQASLPAIRAAANRTQWTDSGLPRTDSHPSAHASRFYRVTELAP